MPSSRSRAQNFTGAELGPLDSAMVARLLEAYVKRKGQPYRPLTEPACAMLLRQSGGNPRLLATFGGLAVFLAILEDTDRVEPRHVEAAVSSGREVELTGGLTPAGIADADEMFALSSPGPATASRVRIYSIAAVAAFACAAAYMPTATRIWRSPQVALEQHVPTSVSDEVPERQARLPPQAAVNVEIAPQELASVELPPQPSSPLVSAWASMRQPAPQPAPDASINEVPQPALPVATTTEKQTDDRSTPIAMPSTLAAIAQPPHDFPSPLLHVVLTFLPGDLAARDRGIRLTRHLRDIGYDATDPIPQTPSRRGSHVDYFFNTDATAASGLATALGNKFGREAMVSGHLEQRRPGTVEIALPSSKAVLSSNSGQPNSPAEF